MIEWQRSEWQKKVQEYLASEGLNYFLKHENDEIRVVTYARSIHNSENLTVHIIEYADGKWTDEPISGNASQSELPFLHKLTAHLRTLPGRDRVVTD